MPHLEHLSQPYICLQYGNERREMLIGGLRGVSWVLWNAVVVLWCPLLAPPQQFLIFTETNLCPANCLPLKGRTSDRFAVLDLFEMWVLSIKVKSRGRDPSLAYLSQCSWLHVLLFRHGRWWNTKSTKDYPILFNSRTICVLLLF